MDLELTNQDIDKLVKEMGIKNYKGTLPSDLLTGKPKNGECAIVNLQPSTQGGSHWIAYYVGTKYNNCFDSYGLPPHDNIVKYLKQNKKPIVYSTNELQMPTSSACGYYCLMWISEMKKGVPYYDFLDRFDLEPSNKNEQIVRKYFDI